MTSSQVLLALCSLVCFLSVSAFPRDRRQFFTSCSGWAPGCTYAQRSRSHVARGASAREAEPATQTTSFSGGRGRSMAFVGNNWFNSRHWGPGGGKRSEASNDVIKVDSNDVMSEVRNESKNDVSKDVVVKADLIGRLWQVLQRLSD